MSNLFLKKEAKFREPCLNLINGYVHLQIDAFHVP